MTDEEREQLAFLEALLAADEELDEDDRATLRELRALARTEKRAEKALAKFNKAKVVYRVANEHEGDSYFLDLATASKWGAAEAVDRQTLVGPFWVGLIEGFTVDGGYDRDEVIASKSNPSPKQTPLMTGCTVTRG